MRLSRAAVLAFAVCVSSIGLALPTALGQESDDSAALQLEPNSGRFFEAYIAPLLARHCLDCHNGATRDGALDLTAKAAAFAGGDSGKAIVAGKSGESLLWQYIESDEMPQNQAPLSEEEKDHLRQWIDAGAVWSIEKIDPEAYAHIQDSRAAATWLQRLTVTEYIQTVRSTVGVDIEEEARRLLPRDERADGFTNTAYNLGVDLAHVEAYSRLARRIVSEMDVKAFASKYATCDQLNEQCLGELIRAMGKHVLRGPLSEPEVGTYLTVSAAVAEAGGDFSEAVGYVLQAMLQSPRFIYRIERQRGEGQSLPADPYELASRLSYMLWGAPPDEVLMQAADLGQLSASEQLESQVQRMLHDPRAIDRSLQFIHEWIDLNRLETLRPNPQRFPQWNEQLAADMQAETLAVFEDLVWQRNRPLSELLNAPFTYATPRLAYHYGLYSDPQGSPVEAASWDRSDKKDLLALYRFNEGKGNTIRDQSQAGERLDLKIESTSATKWDTTGLTVYGSTAIWTAKPPKRLVEAIKKSKALTLEAWITPANTTQAGPARILTLSSGTGERNFTLGQERDRYDVRLRAARTDNNGLPSQASRSGSADTALTHVVYTKDASGQARLYVNGEEQAAGNVGGDLSKWNDSFYLGIANESTKDRPWQGTYHLVAVYGRALSAEEIRAKGAGMSRYDLKGNPTRGGLLTQGSVLTIGGDEASMVTRGLFILHDLLYSRVGNPPPCVDTTPIATRPGMSMRDQAEVRLADSSCTGCHARFEPLAFGLEKFDGIGAYHEIDSHGNKLREDGEIHFPGQDKPVQYKTSAELMNLLADSERVKMAITRKVTQFALGRPLIAADMPQLQQIHAAAQKNGGTYPALMIAIATSDLVRQTRTEPQ